MWVNIFVSAPISALVPILMAVIGIGETTVVVTVFLFAVFVIILDTQVGMKHADRSLVDMARCFGATRRQLYSKILFLSALPEIFAGVRLGVIRGVKGVVIGQLLIAIIGVGELFELYSHIFSWRSSGRWSSSCFLSPSRSPKRSPYFERRVEYYASVR